MGIYRLLGNPQVITLQAGSTPTLNALGAKIVLIRPTVDVFIAVGDAPEAEADGNVSHFVGAGEVFPVEIDQLYQANPASGALGATSSAKLAAIPATAEGIGGKVYLSPLG